MADYEINSTPVNSRTDWRFTPMPGAVQGREEHQFPGVSARYVTTGPVMGDDLIVEGFLEGTHGSTVNGALSALAAALAAKTALKGQGTKSVLIHGMTYPAMELLDVQFTGPTQAMAAASGKAVRRPVRFVWRRLSSP